MTDVFKLINMKGGDTSVCWEWKNKRALSGRDSRPYFNMNGKRYLAYRVVFSVTFGRALSDLLPLRHTCDNPCCCNPYHLIEGTQQQNMDDMKDRERHGLPHHTVKAIKRLLARRVLSHNEIADLFGISRTLVTSIASEVCYKHVEVTQQDMRDSREQDKQFLIMATKLKPHRAGADSKLPLSRDALHILDDREHEPSTDSEDGTNAEQES